MNRTAEAAQAVAEELLDAREELDEFDWMVLLNHVTGLIAELHADRLERAQV